MGLGLKTLIKKGATHLIQILEVNIPLNCSNKTEKNTNGNTQVLDIINNTKTINVKLNILTSIDKHFTLIS